MVVMQEFLRLRFFQIMVPNLEQFLGRQRAGVIGRLDATKGGAIGALVEEIRTYVVKLSLQYIHTNIHTYTVKQIIRKPCEQ